MFVFFIPSSKAIISSSNSGSLLSSDLFVDYFRAIHIFLITVMISKFQYSLYLPYQLRI